MLSRVADSLYWMSRYLERAANTSRILHVQLNLLLDHNAGDGTAVWQRVARSLEVSAPREDASAAEVTRRLAFDAANPESIVASISRARESAKNVREQISADMWEHLNRLWLQVSRAHDEPHWSTLPGDFFDAVSQSACLFMGITASTMSHDVGWQFLRAGRSLESAINLAALLGAYSRAYRSADQLELPGDSDLLSIELLSCTQASEAYSKAGAGDLAPESIIEFLLLDADFPSSLRFAVETLESALAAIDATAHRPESTQVVRRAGKLRSRLEFATLDEIRGEGLERWLESVSTDCLELHEEIYRVYMAYSLSDVLVS